MPKLTSDVTRRRFIQGTAASLLASGAIAQLAHAQAAPAEGKTVGYALVGLGTVFCVIALTARPDLRQAGESKLMSWLTARHEATVGMPVELDAIDRATAANPAD